MIYTIGYPPTYLQALINSNGVIYAGCDVFLSRKEAEEFIKEKDLKDYIPIPIDADKNAYVKSMYPCLLLKDAKIDFT